MLGDLTDIYLCRVVGPRAAVQTGLCPEKASEWRELVAGSLVTESVVLFSFSCVVCRHCRVMSCHLSHMPLLCLKPGPPMTAMIATTSPLHPLRTVAALVVAFLFAFTTPNPIHYDQVTSPALYRYASVSPLILTTINAIRSPRLVHSIYPPTSVVARLPFVVHPTVPGLTEENYARTSA